MRDTAMFPGWLTTGIVGKLRQGVGEETPGLRHAAATAIAAKCRNVDTRSILLCRQARQLFAFEAFRNCVEGVLCKQLGRAYREQ